MKIGIVCYPTFGGSGVVATELGLALADHGHEIHFLTYAQPERLDAFIENVTYHEVDVAPYPLFKYPPYETALTSAIVDLVKYVKLDLLHVHYAIPHASAAYLAKMILRSEGLDIPIITTLHGTDITLVGKNRSYEPVVTFSINQSDGVTAVSNDLRNETLNSFNITNHIEVIPNFIDLRHYNIETKHHFKKAIAPNGEKILVHTSNFRRVKRTEDVMAIFAELRKKMPIKLLMVGDGPEKNKIEAMCRENNFCDDVRFLGKVNAIIEVLSVCDLFLLPSEKESFGLAALEAMAAGVPVISSDAGGLTELNIDGVTGFCLPIGDTIAMANKAAIVLDDTNYATFSHNAKKRASDFELKKILPLYEDFYHRTIAKATQTTHI